jgi:hypothetical protein
MQQTDRVCRIVRVHLLPPGKVVLHDVNILALIVMTKKCSQARKCKWSVTERQNTATQLENECSVIAI